MTPIYEDRVSLCILCFKQIHIVKHLRLKVVKNFRKRVPS